MRQVFLFMRDTWKNSGAFIMTSIGSAVGFGNILRFPFLLNKYGLAFVILYTVFLCVLGLPVMMGETALGRMYRQSSVVCMKSINKKLGILGFFMSGNSFVIMCYYGVLFAFILIMAFFSFKIPFLPLSETGSFFYEITGYNKGIISPVSAIFLILGWALVCFCCGNTDRIGKIATVSVILPVVFLIILAISCLYNNPSAILSLLKINLKALTKPEFWMDTLGQVFYSLSLMVGIMFAFGSYLKESENIFKSCIIIGFSDLFVSLLGGIIYLSVIKSVPTEFDGITSGFSTYPAAIARMTDNPYLNSVVFLLFYFSLILISLNSLFSYVKSITSNLYDKFRINEEISSAVFCIIGLFIGFIFLGKGGLLRISFVDKFAACFLLLITGILETVFIPKYKDLEEISAEINKNTKKFRFPQRLFYISFKFICPFVMIILLIANLIR